MKRNFLNIIIDAVSLAVFSLMISTGLILKFILPPGSGRVEQLLAARGRGHHTIDVFMGLARHDWGVVHLYISLGFLALLIIHLVLHWNWILCMFWGPKGAQVSLKKRLMTLFLVTAVLGVLTFPWVGLSLGMKKSYTKEEYLEMKEKYTQGQTGDKSFIKEKIDSR